MEPPDELRDARFTCSIIPANPAGTTGRHLCLGLILVLAAGAAQLQAQEQSDQYWPPDDSPGNGYPAPIPPHTPNQQYGYDQPQYPQNYPQQPYADSYPQQGPTQQPLTANELAQLVAPIALYPDALVAQILAASTYPAQIAAVDQWRRSMGNAPPEQIAAGAGAQTSWDPSIKALTAFPQVLATLAGNLQWTTALGNAYYNQPQDVLQTVQVMRQRAEEAGNLQGTPQQEVMQDQGNIDIAPANPQIVYVPAYNPWVVYGAPISPYPGFSAIDAFGSFFGSAAVQFGEGLLMNAFLQAPWGFLGWGLDWFGHSVLFDHGNYWTRSTSVRDWGFPHGGPRAYPGNPQWSRGGDRFNWSRNGYNHASLQGSGFGRGNERPIGGPVSRWGDARNAEGFNRGFPPRSGTSMRPAPPQQFAFGGRAEQFNRQGYGGGLYSQPHDNYASRPGMAFARPSPAFRPPENNYQRGNFNSRGYQSYGGRQSKSYSFNGSGGRSNWGSSGSWGGGSGRWAGSGGWGGGSGGWKAPKAPHFGGGGGGHSFGGGHSSGGGHSGGGGGHGHHH